MRPNPRWNCFPLFYSYIWHFYTQTAKVKCNFSIPPYRVIFARTYSKSAKEPTQGKAKKLRTPIIRKLDIKSRSHGIILHLFITISWGSVWYLGTSFSSCSVLHQIVDDKEIISYQAKLFCVIVNATGELKQPRGDGDGDGDRNEKIEKQQI